ncbi:PAS/PAC sensor signal transduction histidine kinase [Bacillus methanolicus PB1]|uniref:histidine kinase n=1 Tax=Bacillus methanolicus PB1 TaxID=997296 RepID=I3E0D9_BACMT|nr:PAS domain S-box protein [Bacillus methanolicus]EIJ79960.1 PAS/PAC sensor signal transduction histidine kinase [Bacillus methanolicus PB1]
MNYDHDVINEDEKYKIVAENTSDIIVLVDNEAIVRYVSPSFQQTLGYTIKEYEGMDAFDIIPPEDRDRVRSSHFQAIQTKTPVVLEYRLIHSQGSIIHVEARVKPVLDRDGNVKYVVAVVRDITERKKTEQLLENILESVNAAVWSTEKDFSYYTFCSESIEKISGIPRREIMFKPIRLHDHIHPDDNEMLMGEVKNSLDRGIPVNKVIRFIHVEGETRWGRLIVHPYMDNTGTIERFDGIILDITELKRSELALEESEQRYKSLFENNLDGVFSIDLNGYFVNANQAFEKITGIKIDQLPDRCFIGLIYDEDHMSVYHILSEVMKKQEPRDVECRIIRSGYGEKIVNITFVPIFLSGELNGVHGIVKDITERKREEMELIQSEERYKSLQQSINRFSNDLANVMKVTELENRLIEEVKKVLPVNSVSIEELPRGHESVLRNMNEIWIKIAEKEQPVYLRIEINQSLLKIEEEWLETAVHYVTILYDNLQLIEDLMKRLEDMVTNNQTPKWMLKLLFKLSEKERALLSSDLHDSVLQDLIIWYRKLESLRSSTSFSEETHGKLIQIEEGLLDAIHQIRITCNELRPPFLLKMGLVESLKSLFSYARMFSNYEIEFSSMNLENPLHEDQILGIYRIVQELLNNASKHSKASKVTMKLTGYEEHIHFSYSDNGVGMDLSVFEGSFKHMGIAGIKNRVLSLEGEVEIKSAPQEGFHVNIIVPTTTPQKGDHYGNIIG